MNEDVQQSPSRWVKDRIIESGADRWARPIWKKLTGQRPLKDDVLLSRVMDRVLKHDSTCIDIGAHKGVILDECIRRAPQGTFYAFEPIPHVAKLLRRKYHGNPRVIFYEVALSDTAGTATFYVDKASLEFSSLRVPSLSKSESDIEPNTVNVARLDDLLPEARPDLIKIDVEGAELGVLRGALKLLARSRPVVAFEHGLGGADRFGTKPEDIFDLFEGLGLHVSLLARYLANEPPLSRGELSRQFYGKLNYFFIAYP